MNLIVIDPGHGGKDSGAVDYGLKEADVALRLAELVNNYLGDYANAATSMTRNKNTSPTYPAPPEGLRKRIAFANSKNADFFLSLHCNAGGGSGFESFVAHNAPARTKQIQKVINDQVLSYLKGYGIGAHGNPAKNDSQAARSRIAVLRDTRMPAVLLECLFIDNPKENKLLRDPKFLDGLAAAIVEGLAEALGLKKKVTKPKPMYRVEVNGKLIYDTAYEGKIAEAVIKAIDKNANKIYLTKL
ncbi:N-acetylmuramoyl-L-alanine amidase [Laceyella sacchari]|uniref:N-acetylmuramoyl-L-alanine amidase n=1 Tax=Laceyella tengchongensis TaxID=574699 RepID=A0AA45WQT1_9BACL|nr:N-acetylmuramoyl-L-alanine amidase [Laceyella tengchongensis]AUS07429.1 N-acetylmuramoyl-L-alanine amidase [Laceyella sacchari]MRG28801.1 N-acetylmuramoyl-L-alanine amidase [Laceyella tengchongensis]SMP24882.1 N-acetylmuramoyl-L-alanine amidase [Laceyella tengchongensis]